MSHGIEGPTALYIRDEPVDRLRSFPLWLNTHSFVILSLVLSFVPNCTYSLSLFILAKLPG